MIQYNSNVAWDGPVGSDQILTAFLHSQFREDTSQRPSFDFGFTALRRSELVRLARDFGVSIPAADAEKNRIVATVQVAWEAGAFGDMTKFSNPGNHVEAQLAAQAAEIAELKEMVRELVNPPDKQPAEESEMQPDITMGRIQEKLVEPTQQATPEVRSMKRGPSEWNVLQKKATGMGIKIQGLDREGVEAEVARIEAEMEGLPHEDE